MLCSAYSESAMVSSITRMKPGEDQDTGLRISFSFYETPFGTALIASTSRGIAYLAFADKKNAALRDLKHRFPHAHHIEASDTMQKKALSIFKKGNHVDTRIHLKGTSFQLKVWHALLQIPFGRLATYGEIARRIRHPKACRAVGTAIGANPVAFLIPCHRVILSRGPLGNYRWGSTRKKKMIDWEGTH